MEQICYTEARHLMKPGDVIAFGGKERISNIIKWATRSNVSHVGVVVETTMLIDGAPQPHRIVDVMESTTLYEDPVTGKKTAGVQRNRLSRRVEYNDGEMWWLPLSDESRQRMNGPALVSFLLNQDRKSYDMKQAIKSGLDFLDAQGATYAKEDLSSFFCSELVAAAFEVAGIINNINASEVTPADLCAFKLYGKAYQLDGSPTPIKGFNSMDPEGFGI